MAQILVVRHEQTCSAGYVSGWLAEEGVTPVEIHPYAGDVVPDEPFAAPLSSPSSFGGLLVLGGDMGAADDDRAPWLPATRRLLRRAVEDRVPTLGLCLGGQLLAAACGGQIGVGQHGPEIGVQPLELAAEADDDPLFGDLARQVRDGRHIAAPQWHHDEIVALPPGAVHLARSATYPRQAFRLGDAAWGVQFHPEAVAEEVAGWAAADADGLAAAGLVADDVLSRLAASAPDQQATWRPVVQRFAGLVRAHTARAHTVADARSTSQRSASGTDIGRATK